MSRLGVRDADGWCVPSPGTKSRLIYGVLKHGLSTSEIADEQGPQLQLGAGAGASHPPPASLESSSCRVRKAGRKAIPTTSACAPTTALCSIPNLQSLKFSYEASSAA
jgi:hypothetical protein